jgi:hypothetical protein
MSADAIDGQRLRRLKSPTDKLSGRHAGAADPAGRTHLGRLQYNGLSGCLPVAGQADEKSRRPRRQTNELKASHCSRLLSPRSRRPAMPRYASA